MKILSVFIVLGLLSGCAYKFGPHARNLPAGAKTIHVSMFKNRTQDEVGLEADFTDAFIQALERSGVAEVTSAGSADLILNGVIHMVAYQGRASVGMPDNFQSQAPLFTEYQTTATIILRAVDKNGKEVWQGQFLGEKNYKAPQLTTPGLRTANPLYNQSARRQTLREIARELSVEAVSKMTENF